MHIPASPAALLHLLQLASPTLPIGGYSYSQGLEAAMEKGLVHDEASARDWLIAALDEVVTRFDAPLLWRLLQAWSTCDSDAIAYWTAVALAGRDTTEFRAETVQMGYSLAGLTTDLAIADTKRQAILAALPEVPLHCALACAAVAMGIPAEATLLGMLFSWAENQVLVCVKSVPLGQVAGQRLLLSLHPALAAAALKAQTLEDDDLGNWTPGLSLLSMQHETQYSRLYRS